MARMTAANPTVVLAVSRGTSSTTNASTTPIASPSRVSRRTGTARAPSATMAQARPAATSSTSSSWAARSRSGDIDRSAVRAYRGSAPRSRAWQAPGRPYHGCRPTDRLPDRNLHVNGVRMDLVIKNGTLVTASDTYLADLGIEGERIVQIGQDLTAPGARVIDAAGKYVLPGGVDPHTHLDSPSQGTSTADNFLSGTVAAACGGTTSLVNFCFQEKGKGLNDSLAGYADRAAGKAAIDYGFHAMISDFTEQVEQEIPSLPEQGVTSIKLFMAYRGSRMVDDRTLARTLDQARRVGVLVMVSTSPAR